MTARAHHGFTCSPVSKARTRHFGIRLAPPEHAALARHAAHGRRMTKETVK